MKSTSNYEKEALAILDKINDIRENPVKYSTSLEKFRSCYKGKNFNLEKNSHLPTQEGVSALEELIEFTKKLKRRSSLDLENGLNLTLKEFCDSVKSSEELNEAYNSFDSDKIGAKYGTYGSGRIQVYMVNLITEDLDKNVLFLLLCDGDDSRQIRDLLLDGKFTKIGIFIRNYPKEDTPMLTLLLADEYKTKSQFENKDKSGVEELVASTEKIDLGKKTEKKAAPKQGEDSDPDLDLPEGVVKIERKSKNVKENGKEYVITKTVTHMEDGSVNTEVKKEKKN